MLLFLTALLAQDPAPTGALVVEPVALDVPENTAFSNLAQGADGHAYLSWVERKGERSGSLSYARFEKDGWGPAHTIYTGDDLFLNWADFPTLAVLADGTLLASWLKFGGPRWHDYAAMYSLSNDSGKTWARPQTIHSDASSCEHGFVSVIALDEERFGALWLDGRGTVDKPEGEGATAVYFRTIDKDGKLGEEVVVDPRVCDCCPTTLVRNGDGVFAGFRDRSSKEVRDVAHSRLGKHGWTTSERIFPDEWKIEGCPVNGPRFAAQGKQTVAAWFTGAGGGGGRVNVAFFLQGNQAYAFPSPVRVDEGSPVGRADTVFLEDGSVLVSWLEYTEDTGVWRVRRVTKDGEMSAAVTVAETASDRKSGHLRMVADGDGALVTWTDSEANVVRTARVKPAAD